MQRNREVDMRDACAVPPPLNHGYFQGAECSVSFQTLSGNYTPEIKIGVDTILPKVYPESSHGKRAVFLEFKRY